MRRICRPVWSHIAAHIADCLCFCSLSARNSAGSIPGCTSCICFTEFEGHIDDPLHFLTVWQVKTIYPEAEITATAATERRASCHSKNIPEARGEMISGFPIPALATVRPKKRYSRKLNSTLQRSARAQATLHSISDHEENIANRAVQLIAGRSNFRVEATVIRRSGTGDAGSRASRVPSLPFSAIHPHRQPAIPDGGR
jgi:hypothetical protein